MNKSDLAVKLAQSQDITFKMAESIVNAIFDTMASELERGGRIEIRGFGSFVVREYGGYEGRNPKTGEKIRVEPKKSPFFKVGKEMRLLVNGGKE